MTEATAERRLGRARRPHRACGQSIARARTSASRAPWSPGLDDWRPGSGQTPPASPARARLRIVDRAAATALSAPAQTPQHTVRGRLSSDRRVVSDQAMIHYAYPISIDGDTALQHGRMLPRGARPGCIHGTRHSRSSAVESTSGSGDFLAEHPAREVAHLRSGTGAPATRNRRIGGAEVVRRRTEVAQRRRAVAQGRLACAEVRFQTARRHLWRDATAPWRSAHRP